MATAKTTSSKNIIEWAPFELAEGVSDETLLKASNTFQNEFVNAQKGFIRRELLKGKDGQWVDLIFWESKEDAEKVMENVESSDACRAFFQIMKAAAPNDPGAGVLHFEHIKSYKP